MPNQSLSLEEKERIIAEKVAAFKWPTGRVFFYIDGGGTTRTLRDFWCSDKVAHTIKTGVEGFGMDKDTVIKICTGKMMVIGDSRIESYPGGLEGVDDDGRFGEVPPSIEEMVTRLEKIFVESTAKANAAKRDYDILLALPTRAGHEARGPFKKKQGLGGPKKLQTIEGQTEKAKEAIAGLEILYPYVGKTMADLPIEKIPVYPSDMEAQFAEAEWRKSEAAIERPKHGAGGAPMPDMSWANPPSPFEDEKEDAEDNNIRSLLKECFAAAGDEDEQLKMTEWFAKLSEEQIDTLYDDLKAKNFEAVYAKVRELKRWPQAKEEEYPMIGSAWITPEGRIFGGGAYAWIHHHILDSLHETDYFKDLPYNGSEDSVEFNGWIKLSGDHGFMMWNHKRGHAVITEEQKDAIIDLCLAQGLEAFDWNGRKCTLEEFVNSDCDSIMKRF